MAIREDCSYCQDSMPFYRKLTAARGANERAVIRLVVVSTDAAPSMSAHLRASQVQVDDVVSITPGKMKIPGTPLLLLVDGNGKVKQVWRGRLGPQQEREVLAALGMSQLN
jgi:hypothetical protein